MMRQHIAAKAQALGHEARERGEGADVTDEIQDMRKRTIVIIMSDNGFVFIYLFIQAYCPYAALGYERPTPHL
jgi:hypothetical protein